MIEDPRKILDEILSRYAHEPSTRHPGYSVYTIGENENSSVKVIAKFVRSTPGCAEFDVLGAYVARPERF